MKDGFKFLFKKSKSKKKEIFSVEKSGQEERKDELKIDMDGTSAEITILKPEVSTEHQQ